MQKKNYVKAKLNLTQAIQLLPPSSNTPVGTGFSASWICERLPYELIRTSEPDIKAITH